MSEIAIRKARDEDLPAISALWFEMMNYHLTRDRRFAIAHDAGTTFATWLKSLLQDPEAAYVAVAEENGQVVGYILGQIETLPPVYSITRVGVIRDLCVMQGARHHGVGTRMFQHSLGWFKNRAVEAIWARIPWENKVALQFWESLAFKPFNVTMRLEFPS
jgi:ribosomal protein S18 acetylase RimI-like enzyme